MEHGKLSRDAFMREIAEMTKHIVKKAKEYDRDTVPGDYATLHTPCPNCGGVVQGELPPLHLHRQAGTARAPAASRSRKIPAGRAFELHEVEQFLRDKQHRPARGLPLQGGLAVHRRDRAEVRRGREELEARVRLRRRRQRRRDRRARSTSAGQEPLGPCPKCGGARLRIGHELRLRELGADGAQPSPTCDFKSGKIILQQPVAREQMTKLLATGKTDLLDKLRLDAHPPRRSRPSWPGTRRRARSTSSSSRALQVPAAQAAFARRAPPPRRQPAAARKTRRRRRPAPRRPPAAKKAARRRRRARPAPGLKPSPELAAVIGAEPVARTEVIKKLWDYIKAHGLQDAKNKRAINADDKLLPVFGKPQVTMFELAGRCSAGHLS